MDFQKEFSFKVAALISHHGDIATLTASSGCRAQDWRRWATGRVPSRRCQGRVEAALQAAGISSPWASRYGEAVPLFDPISFEPSVWADLAKATVERMEDAMFCRYCIVEDRRIQVVLRDDSVQGGTLTTWRVVAYATRSYALRLSDGRLLEYVEGSAVPLVSDTQARREARAKTLPKRRFRAVA